MTQSSVLCTVEHGLVDHVRQLLADAGLDSGTEPGSDDRVAILVDSEDTEHARAVIGLVLPHLLEDLPRPGTLSDRLIRSEDDGPPLPGGLLDARPTHGYADPLDEPDLEVGEDYVPPPPPPVPRPRDRLSRAAWVAVILGPLLLIGVPVLGLPGYLTPLGLLLFFGGFGLLVARMDDGRGRGDGWDDGAVV